MVNVPSLPQPQRLILAELSGVARRYGTDGMRDAPRDVAIAAVRAVTEDPVLLGVQAGVALVDPHGINGPVVELLQAAGADVAEEHAVEVRERLSRGLC